VQPALQSAAARPVRRTHLSDLILCEKRLQFQEQIFRFGESEAEAVRSRRSDVPLKGAISKRSVAPSALLVSTNTVHFARVISQPSLSKSVP
jgi:hypothetical protein